MSVIRDDQRVVDLIVDVVIDFFRTYFECARRAILPRRDQKINADELTEHTGVRLFGEAVIDGRGGFDLGAAFS